MTILSRPNSIVSDCSSLGQLDDVTPFTSFEADPLNLGFQTKQCSFGSLNVNSLLGQDRLHQIELILKSNNFSAQMNRHHEVHMVKGSLKDLLSKSNGTKERANLT